MTEIEQMILEALRLLNEAMVKVFSYEIAAEIEKIEARQVRNHLVRLERIGLVKRPNGKHSGWVVA